MKIRFGAFADPLHKQLDISPSQLETEQKLADGFYNASCPWHHHRRRSRQSSQAYHQTDRENIRHITQRTYYATHHWNNIQQETPR